MPARCPRPRHAAAAAAPASEAARAEPQGCFAAWTIAGRAAAGSAAAGGAPAPLRGCWQRWGLVRSGESGDARARLLQLSTRLHALQARQVWWIDPAGAILISAYIIFSWALILRNQVRRPPGRGARAPAPYAGAGRIGARCPCRAAAGVQKSCACTLMRLHDGAACMVHKDGRTVCSRWLSGRATSAGPPRQVDKIVGASAPEDTLSALEALATAHHERARPAAAPGCALHGCPEAEVSQLGHLGNALHHGLVVAPSNACRGVAISMYVLHVPFSIAALVLSHLPGVTLR